MINHVTLLTRLGQLHKPQKYFKKEIKIKTTPANIINFTIILTIIPKPFANLVLSSTIEFIVEYTAHTQKS